MDRAYVLWFKKIGAFFLFCCSFMLSAHDFDMRIQATHQDAIDQLIDQKITKPVLIESIDYCSDVIFSQQEFDYLTGLQAGSYADATDFKKAIFYLLRKNKFETIAVTGNPGLVGICIHFEFTGCWTFHALKVHGGLLVGRERYRHLYMMDSGDPFDKQKHEHSVRTIKHELYKEGFFNAVLVERLDYDQSAKNVTVHITPKRGKQFTIGSVGLTIAGDAQYATINEALHNKIRSTFTNRLEGGLYSKDRLNTTAAALKRFLASEGWVQAAIKLEQTVKPDSKQVNLHLTIDLNQKKEFVFFGNNHFNDAQLLEQLMHFGGSHVVPASILNEELLTLYHKAGFLQARVSVEDAPDRLYFLIQEGPRAQIAQISFVGVTHFDHAQLVKKSGGLALEGKYFEQLTLHDVLKKIVDLYGQEGFWQTNIVGHECKPTSVPGWYDLVITVQQGNQSTIAHVTIQMPEGQPAPPAQVCAIKTGQLFTPDIITRQRQELATRYPDIFFTPEIIHDVDSVSINWVAQSEKPVPFGKTVITGSSKIPFEYIMRELRYKQGDAWDPLKMKRSLVALKELDIFDSISIYPYQQAVPFDEKPMILKIIPDDPFELRARTGIGFEYAGKELTYKGVTYKLGGAMVFKNPFNYADYFFANADFTRTHRIMEAGYWRPWLFGYPLQTLVQLYNNAFQYPGIIGTQRNLYKVRQAGGLLGLVNKWQAVQAGVNIGFECMETTISNKRPQEGLFNRLIARAINFEPALLDKWVPYFLLEPTVFIDTVDNQLYPTCGMITLCSIKGMIPVGRLDNTFFIKLMAEQSVFVPLWPTVLALRLRFGHIFYQQFNNIMPSERFYLGGANSIRSYQTDLCPPLGVLPTGPAGKKNFVPQGGKSMLNGNIELRVPLYKELWGAVFQDFGFLHGGNKLADLIKADLLAGTGFGLRYNTPIGPLRFDIGFKWKKPNPAIPRFAWFLTLGQPF